MQQQQLLISWLSSFLLQFLFAVFEGQDFWLRATSVVSFNLSLFFPYVILNFSNLYLIGSKLVKNFLPLSLIPDKNLLLLVLTRVDVWANISYIIVWMRITVPRCEWTLSSVLVILCEDAALNSNISAFSLGQLATRRHLFSRSRAAWKTRLKEKVILKSHD